MLRYPNLPWQGNPNLPNFNPALGAPLQSQAQTNLSTANHSMRSSSSPLMRPAQVQNPTTQAVPSSSMIRPAEGPAQSPQQQAMGMDVSQTGGDNATPIVSSAQEPSSPHPLPPSDLPPPPPPLPPANSSVNQIQNQHVSQFGGLPTSVAGHSVLMRAATSDVSTSSPSSFVTPLVTSSGGEVIKVEDQDEEEGEASAREEQKSKKRKASPSPEAQANESGGSAIRQDQLNHPTAINSPPQARIKVSQLPAWLDISNPRPIVTNPATFTRGGAEDGKLATGTLIRPAETDGGGQMMLTKRDRNALASQVAGAGPRMETNPSGRNGSTRISDWLEGLEQGKRTPTDALGRPIPAKVPTAATTVTPLGLQDPLPDYMPIDDVPMDSPLPTTVAANHPTAIPDRFYFGTNFDGTCPLVILTSPSSSTSNSRGDYSFCGYPPLDQVIKDKQQNVPDATWEYYRSIHNKLGDVTGYRMWSELKKKWTRDMKKVAKGGTMEEKLQNMRARADGGEIKRSSKRRKLDKDAESGKDGDSSMDIVNSTDDDNQNHSKNSDSASKPTDSGLSSRMSHIIRHGELLLEAADSTATLAGHEWERKLIKEKKISSKVVGVLQEIEDLRKEYRAEDKHVHILIFVSDDVINGLLTSTLQTFISSEQAVRSITGFVGLPILAEAANRPKDNKFITVDFEKGAFQVLVATAHQQMPLSVIGKCHYIQFETFSPSLQQSILKEFPRSGESLTIFAEKNNILDRNQLGSSFSARPPAPWAQPVHSINTVMGERGTVNPPRPAAQLPTTARAVSPVAAVRARPTGGVAALPSRPGAGPAVLNPSDVTLVAGVVRPAVPRAVAEPAAGFKPTDRVTNVKDFARYGLSEQLDRKRIIRFGGSRGRAVEVNIQSDKITTVRPILAHDEAGPTKVLTAADTPGKIDALMSLLRGSGRTDVASIQFEHSRRENKHDAAMRAPAALRLPRPICCPADCDSERAAKYRVRVTALIIMFLEGRLDGNWKPTPEEAAILKTPPQAPLQPEIAPVRAAVASPAVPVPPQPVVALPTPMAANASSSGKLPFKAPDFWFECIRRRQTRKQGSPLCYWPTLFRFKPNAKSTPGFKSNMYRSFVMLLPEYIGRIPDGGFELWHDIDQLDVEVFHGRPIFLNPEEEQIYHRFTLRMFRLVTRRFVAGNLEDLPYAIAPVSAAWDAANSSALDSMREVDGPISLDLSKALDLQEIVASSNENGVPFSQYDEEELQAILPDVMLLHPDQNTGSRFSASIRQDLTPRLLEISPTGVSPDANTVRNTSTVAGLSVTDMNQPMIQIDQIADFKNMLSPAAPPKEDTEQTGISHFMVPEVCQHSTVSLSVYRSAQTMPSVIGWLDTFLLASEVNIRYLGGEARVKDVMAAITTSEALRHVNYQRLEMFGDTVYKFAMVAYVHQTHPPVPQTRISYQSIYRQVTDNVALHASLLRSDAYRYIVRDPLYPRKWLPINCGKESQGQWGIDDLSKIKADGSYKSLVREASVGPKVLADVSESLVGAAAESGGMPAALDAMRALGANLPSPIRWKDFKYAPKPDVPNVEPATEAEIQLVFEITGYKFKDPGLLGLALNYLNPTEDVNMQLDRCTRLGTGLLEYLVIHFAYRRPTKPSISEMTLIKMTLLATETVCVMAIMSGLCQHYRFQTLPNPEDSINATQAFTERLKTFPKTKREFWKSDEFKASQDFEEVHFLNDMVRSLFALILIDNDWNVDATEQVFTKIYGVFYEEYASKYDDVDLSRMKEIERYLYENGCVGLDGKHGIIPGLKKGDRMGQPTFNCLIAWHGVLIGESVGYAHVPVYKRSTKQAMTRLRKMDEAEFRQSCDCKTRKVKAVDDEWHGWEDEEENTAEQNGDAGAIVAGDVQMASE